MATGTLRRSCRFATDFVGPSPPNFVFGAPISAAVAQDRLRRGLMSAADFATYPRDFHTTFDEGAGSWWANDVGDELARTLSDTASHRE